MRKRNHGASDGAAPEQIVLERRQKIKKYLGVTAIGVAGGFLFLPDLAIFDFLPDFIGYVILLLGISQLRDLNDYFGDAYDRFYKIAWISAARFLSFFLVLGLVTPQERPDTMLLVAFVFGVFDFIFLLPAWKDLFEGFSYLNARSEEATFDRIVRKPKRVRRNDRRKGLRVGDEIPRKPLSRIERTRKVTLFFVGAKTVLNVLPEFAALTADTELDASFRLYDYIGFLRVGAILCSAVIGTVFLVTLCRFVSAVKRDGAFLSFYREKYRTEVLTKDHIFVHRHLQNALFIASIASVFRIDLRMDHMHLLPDALMALLFLLSVFLLGKHVGDRRRFTVAAVVYSVFSFGVGLYEYYFHYNFSVTSIQTNEAASRAFAVLSAVKVLEQGLFLLTVALFLLLLRNVIRSYTGFSVDARETLEPTEKIRVIHRDLEKRLKLVFVFAVISAAAKVLLTVLALEGRPGLELDFMPVVDFLTAVLFAFFAIRTVREIYSQVEYRFMLL